MQHVKVELGPPLHATALIASIVMLIMASWVCRRYRHVWGEIQ